MAKSRQRRRRTAADVFLTLVLLIAIGVFCFAGYNLITIYLQYKEGRDQYSDMADRVVTERTPDASLQQGGGTPASSGETSAETIEPPMDIDFTSLKSTNDDVIGWIYVEAFEGMSYPVTRGIDNEFYLHRNIQKEYLYAGTVFADKLNSDTLDDCYTILYGHNMKDGSMFGKLSEFITEPQTLSKSRYFWVFTPQASCRYQIISVYNAAVDSDTYTNYKGPGQEYESFLSRVQGYSEVYIDPVELNIKDKLMCLSTCLDNHDYSKRCVVIGKLVNYLPEGA